MFGLFVALALFEIVTGAPHTRLEAPSLALEGCTAPFLPLACWPLPRHAGLLACWPLPLLLGCWPRSLAQSPQRVATFLPAPWLLSPSISALLARAILISFSRSSLRR